MGVIRWLKARRNSELMVEILEALEANDEDFRMMSKPGLTWFEILTLQNNIEGRQNVIEHIMVNRRSALTLETYVGKKPRWSNRTGWKA